MNEIIETDFREIMTERGETVLLRYSLSRGSRITVSLTRGDWTETAVCSCGGEEAMLRRLLHTLAEGTVTPVCLAEVLREQAKNGKWAGLFCNKLL